MALALRAYYEQENNFGVTDRIEIHVDGFGGTALELTAGENGFTFNHYEVTDEEQDDLLSAHQNRLMIGRLDFMPRIQTTDERTFLTEIADDESTDVVLIWKRDGTQYWKGLVDLKMISYPESGGAFIAHIRASDLEYLKTLDYKPSGSLPDANQTLIETLAELLAYTTFNLNIKTATSWTNANFVSGTDFLSQAYIDTYALRNYGATGDEEDSPISVWEALKYVSNQALIIKQIDGKWWVEQITAFDDPSAVYETEYDDTGSVVTATATVDRRQNGYTKEADGKPTVKITSQNNSYPALKRVQIRFNHRSEGSFLTLPSVVSLTTSPVSYDQDFISTGEQTVEMSGRVTLYDTQNIATGYAEIMVRVGQYYWDGSSWTTTSTDRITIPISGAGVQDDEGNYVYTALINISTNKIPNDATTPMEVQFEAGVLEAGPDIVADETVYTSINFSVVSPDNQEANSTATDFQLTQSGGYTENMRLPQTIYGDGPVVSAYSAIRYSIATNDITVNDWGFRGGTNDKNFHEVYLKEVMNLQRNRTRKMDSRLWGEYQPYSVLVYNGTNFYYVGGTYSEGRWMPVLMEINVQTGSDTFEQLLKYVTDTGTIGNSSFGGGGGGASELNDLNDASVSSPALNEALLYDGNNFANREILPTDIGDGNYNINGYIDFQKISTPANPSTNIARFYNVDEGGFSTLHYVNSSGVDFEINRDTVHIARNESGSTITAGTPVYISGSNGNYPTIAPADASSTSTLPVFGFAVQDISNNAFGEILEQGDLSGIDLSAYTQGDKVYLASGGGLTATRPTGDTPVVVVGVVIKAVANGILEVESEGIRDYIEPTLNAEFNNLDVNGVINYVSETNLQVEDKTITVNKGGTDASSVGSGIIVERVGTDKSIKWDGTGWALNGTLFFTDGEIQDVGTGASPTFAETVTITSGNLINTLLEGDNIALKNNRTAGGGWARSLMAIRDTNDSEYFAVWGRGTAQTYNNTLIGKSYNDYTLKILHESFQGYKGVGVAGALEIGISGTNSTGGLTNSTAGSVTINNQLLFTVGNEQLLSTDASPTFAGATLTDDFSMINSGDQIFKIQRADDAFGFRIYRDSVGGVFEFQVGQTANPATWHTAFDLGEGATRFNIQPDGGVTNFGGDVDITSDLDVSGVATLETAQIQTLRTTLFKPTTVNGLGGETVFNALSTVITIDTTNDEIDVEDAVFTAGDSVIVSSAIYNQSGFSNVELTLDSLTGTQPSTGQRWNYTVNSGSDLDIATGDTVVKVNGTLIYVDATEGGDAPAIYGYKGISGFSDSPLSGGTANPAWEILSDEFNFWDSAKWRTKLATTAGAFSLTETSEINDGTNRTITGGSGSTTHTSAHFTVPVNDAIRVTVTISDTQLNGSAIGGTLVCAIRTSGGTSLLSSSFETTGNGQSGTIEFSYSDETETDFEIHLLATVDGDPLNDSADFTVDSIVVDSYDSRTTLSLDGLFFDNTDVQMAELSRTKNQFGGVTILSDLPTIDPKRVGQLYNDNGTVKISAG